MSEDEQVKLDQAIAAAGGNYRKGLEKLQGRLMHSQLDLGYTTVEAQRRCKKLWPGIFTASAHVYAS